MDLEKLKWGEINETDFLIANKASIIKDVTVLNKVNIVCDYKMLAYRMKFNNKIERNKMILKKKKNVVIE